MRKPLSGWDALLTAFNPDGLFHVYMECTPESGVSHEGVQ
jgi:hypothetical protein